MKAKHILGLLSLSALFFTACNDDDVNIYNEPVMDASSVTTGSSDVTSTSATLYGTVKGLTDRNSASYSTGFNYTTSTEVMDDVTESDLKSSVNATVTDGTMSATLTDLMPGTIIYYQSYVTLSSTVTFKGEIKSLVTTDAKISSTPAEVKNAFNASVSSSFTEAPEGSVAGITLSPSSDVEAVRAGVHMVAAENVNGAGTAKSTISGLVPGTTYYFAPYVNVGPGEVYGEVQSFTTPAYNFDLDNDLVDLGLPSGLKWAKYNVGTDKETETGGLYGFGDVSGYNASINPAEYGNGGNDTYKTAKDVAAVAYGNKATLPTAEDWEELFNTCTLSWTTVEGVNGYKVTGPNGNYIFLPAAGSRTISEVSDNGVKGLYLTGTAGSSANYFNAYEFSGNSHGRSVLPVYQAVSARAVSTSRDVKFNEELLLNTWELDLNEDGTSSYFNGPVWFYGVDDSWDTVTNGIPSFGDSWLWDADASNTWIFGEPANTQGSMTFSIDENGNRIVKVNQYVGDGTFKSMEGTYTIDPENKTITLTDCEILVPTTYLGNVTTSLSNKVKILSVNSNGLQLGVVRAEDPCLLSMNYIPQLKKYGFEAKLTCYADYNDDHWNEIGTVTIPSGSGALGEHTIAINTTNPRNTAYVYVIDIPEFANEYPNALITVESIKADGVEIPFDANKLYYGNIEGQGAYRIELANIWGCGHNEAWNGLADTPYRPEGGEVEGEDRLGFNESFEVTFNIRSLNAAQTFYPTLVTINPDWGGSWDWNDGSNFSIALNDAHQWEVSQPKQTIAITPEASGADMSKGSIMTFVQINDLYSLFPGVHAALNDIKIDGNSLSGWDASKVLDQNGDGDGKTYRLELFNKYGATANNCGFGTAVADGDGNPDYIEALGFNNSMSLDYTIERLFAIPDWN